MEISQMPTVLMRAYIKEHVVPSLILMSLRRSVSSNVSFKEKIT